MLSFNKFEPKLPIPGTGKSTEPENVAHLKLNTCPDLLL